MTTEPTPHAAPRAHLRTQPAPFGTPPTVVSFRVNHAGGTLTVAYVPDRDLLDRTSLPAYLAALSPATPEETVAAIGTDLANELVPKWYRVTLALTDNGIAQTIAVEDRQPGWDHPSLLTALS